MTTNPPASSAQILAASPSDQKRTIVLLQAHQIEVSAYANRLPETVDTTAFRTILDSIKSFGGNTVPVCVRPLSTNALLDPADDSQRYELASGHIRLAVCRMLDVPVLAMIDFAMTDAEMVVHMHNENHARTNLRPYEYGKMLQSWLDMALFVGVRDIARAIGRDVSDVSRAVSLANLPECVIAAFGSALELHAKDADRLHGLLRDKKEAVHEAAKKLEGARHSRPQVLQILTAAVRQAGIEAADPGSIAMGQVPGSRRGVGSTNTSGSIPGADSALAANNRPRKTPLQAHHGAVGEVRWDGQGLARINVSVAMAPWVQMEFEKKLAQLIGRLSKVEKT